MRELQELLYVLNGTGHTISTTLHGLLCEVLLQGVVDSLFGVHFDFDCRL